MNELERSYRGFSNPLEPFSDEFLDAVTVTHAREITQRFLERFAGRLSERSEGLVSALEQWFARKASFDDVWDVAFGRLRAALKAKEPRDVVRAAVAVGLRLAERGCKAGWEARLRCDTRLRIGRLVLPAADRLRVFADGRRLSVQISRRRRVTRLALPQPVRHETVVKGADTLAAAEAERVNLVVLRRDALEAREFAEVRARVDHAPESIVPPLDATLRLIGKHSPPYLLWIKRAVRQILPLRDNPAMMMSSSDVWRPGVLFSANRPDPASLAEMLIHEGTHQYMYILRRLGPLDDGSDRRLYHSPVSGKMRPLATIVLAYHALANVTLFCRSCPSGSRVRPRQAERSFAPALHAYADILRRSTALTPEGQALWRPLYERLD